MAAKLERIGRIGVVTDQAPVVVPVNSTVHDNASHLRIGDGFVAASADGNLVAFEANQVDSAGAPPGPVAGNGWTGRRGERVCSGLLRWDLRPYCHRHAPPTMGVVGTDDGR